MYSLIIIYLANSNYLYKIKKYTYYVYKMDITPTF